MLQFYTTPFSRATSVHWLLEEIGEPYEVKLIDIRGKVPDDYKKIQAHKKVPAIVDEKLIVTERAAITLYLCEKFPHKNLAPVVGDPTRASFLSNLVYSDSVIDPALSAKALNLNYEASATSFGSFEDMLAHVEGVLSKQTYVLGPEFSAIDTQWGCALHWGMVMLKTIPKKKVFEDYLQRVTSRPAFSKVMKDEESWMARVTPPKDYGE